MQIRSYFSQIPITLFFSASAIFAFAASDLAAWMTIDLRNIGAGDLHRVFTCHLMHWSANHLVWDLVMFATLGAIAEVNMPRRYKCTMLLSALLIPVGVILHHPEMATYRGLSGVDTALFGLVVTEQFGCRLVERNWKSASWFLFLLTGLMAKLLIENLAGTNLFVDDASFIPVPIAHLIGAVIGLLIGSVSYLKAQRQLSSSTTLPGTGIHAADIDRRAGFVGACPGD